GQPHDFHYAFRGHGKIHACLNIDERGRRVLEVGFHGDFWIFKMSDNGHYRTFLEAISSPLFAYFLDGISNKIMTAINAFAGGQSCEIP
ncbi:MAG: hypothetical protein OXE56_05795, partial [Gammaproteobacteria bacterium]|nr:hypothetical protein [Gammaproteobacteria bacterium]